MPIWLHVCHVANELRIPIPDVMFDIRKYRERNQLAHSHINEFAKQKDWDSLAHQIWRHRQELSKILPWEFRDQYEQFHDAILRYQSQFFCSITLKDNPEGPDDIEYEIIKIRKSISSSQETVKEPTYKQRKQEHIARRLERKASSTSSRDSGSNESWIDLDESDFSFGELGDMIDG